MGRGGGQEADWIAAAKAGSDAAFARLVAAHQAPVRAFLRRVLGTDHAEADDLAQETFLAAWTRLHGLKDPSALRSWLCGIAWRKARDRIRSRIRDRTRETAWLAASPPPPGVHAEDRLAMEAAMNALTPEARACVALCLAEGWSHSEAAAALDLPLGTIKSHVVRGRAALLRALGGSDG